LVAVIYEVGSLNKDYPYITYVTLWREAWDYCFKNLNVFFWDNKFDSAGDLFHYKGRESVFWNGKGETKGRLQHHHYNFFFFSSSSS
jgi:hypothetical protein